MYTITIKNSRTTETYRVHSAKSVETIARIWAKSARVIVCDPEGHILMAF